MKVKGMVKAAGLVAVGAGLAYLGDPDRGRARRARALDQARARVRRAGRRAASRSRDAAGRLEGTAARARGAGTYTPESDVDLREHLHQVLAEAGVPTSDVTVDVAHGVATLRGQLGSSALIARAHEAVVEVPGVTRCESYLHLPGSPAPNKSEAIEAAR